MSADLLREAAARARRLGTAPAALGADFNDPRHIAVADWLTHEADHFDMDDTTRTRALAVARAYLGRDA